MSTTRVRKGREEHTHLIDPKLRPAARQSCERAAGIFRALGDPSRLQILFLLTQRALCVSEITEILQDNLSAVSQRLKLLKSERVVVSRREGKHVIYSLTDHHVRRLIVNGVAHAEE